MSSNSNDLPKRKGSWGQTRIFHYIGMVHRCHLLEKKSQKYVTVKLLKDSTHFYHYIWWKIRTKGEKFCKKEMPMLPGNTMAAQSALHIVELRHCHLLEHMLRWCNYDEHLFWRNYLVGSKLTKFGKRLGKWRRGQE